MTKFSNATSSDANILSVIAITVLFDRCMDTVVCQELLLYEFIVGVEKLIASDGQIGMLKKIYVLYNVFCDR